MPNGKNLFADRPLISCLPRSVNVVADFSDGYDAYRAGDYKAAVSVESLRRKGDIDSQYVLGSIYSDGKELLQDYEEAVKWYTKAAEQGHEMAQQLGNVYRDGKEYCRTTKKRLSGTPKRRSKVLIWLNLI